MGFFEEYAKLGSEKINPALLWDQDLSTFDWWKGRYLVVQRVIERGRPEDFCAAFKMYGGIKGFREIIKYVPYLSPKDMNFACVYFELNKEDLRCYTRRQLRERLFNS